MDSDARATATPSWRRLPSATRKKKDVLDWNPEVRRIVPDRKNRGVYQRQYRVFRQLYERNRDLMAELS